MKRREFIQKGFLTGMAVGLAPSGLISAMNRSSVYDLVAVKNGEPAAMFDKAIAALGGMRQYVKPNQTVVVKPNIGWDAAPERAANTNPLLVGRIVKHCIDAGAKIVYVFDHTCDTWQKAYQNSGIEKAAKENGGKVVPGNADSYYHEVDIPRGVILKKVKEHELIQEADVFINVPVLKNHGGATLTIAMKNLMGIVLDRRYWHANNLHQCIADYASFRKPTLNVVDAYKVMKKNGPQGRSVEDVMKMKSLIISTDILAVDVAAVKLFGMEPGDVGYIQAAADLGVGQKDLSTLNIKRIVM